GRAGRRMASPRPSASSRTRSRSSRARSPRTPRRSEAASAFDVRPPPMIRVRAGIDRLLESPWPVVGKRVGLITNQSGVTSDGVPTWRALRGAANVRLVRLFGPEHGLAGGAVYMEAVGASIHAPSGLPVVSLYGKTAESLRPRREDLADLEAIVFHLADVGSPHYPSIWTMLPRV